MWRCLYRVPRSDGQTGVVVNKANGTKEIYNLSSGLSLVLNKEGLWLSTTDTQPERPARPDLIHTSCRSESSNISLVVLDNFSVCPNGSHARWESGIHFLEENSELVKLHCLSPGVSPSGPSPTCLRPQTWRGFETKSARSRKRENPRQLGPGNCRPSVGWDLN
jgi:hypothetical protein